MANVFNVVPENEEEEFPVDFGEVIQVSTTDFNKLENRPSYAGEAMTGDTNIPKVGAGILTVEKNGTSIGTFSANADKNTTINIAVPTTTSELTNDANFQNANDLSSAISTHNQSTSAHQDIRQAITDEATARFNADNSLQGQIDAITSASDVVDIVGTYAELQAYDTQHLKDNDVIKVLQDSTHNDAMTYWRWSTHTQTWTYIGAEGPYYTKSETNTLLDEKLDSDEVPDGFFDGPATVNPNPATSVTIENSIRLKSIELLGDTTQTGTPTPTSPQNVQTVTGEQNVLVHGKNIFDKNNAQFLDGYFENNGTIITTSPGRNAVIYLPCEGSKTYAIKGQTITNLSSRSFATTSQLPANNVPVNGFVSGLDDVTIATPSGAKYLCIRYQSATGTTASSIYQQIIDSLMIEEGSTSSDYEPYQGATYTVDLGSIELCKIGNYQDYIYKSGDDWYVHKMIKKMIFDGSSDENWDNLSNTKLFRIRVTDLIGQDDGAVVGPILSNYYIPAAYNDLSSSQSIMNYGVALRAAASNGVGIKNVDVANVAEFKTWLSNNNTIVYAPLATPTDTKITDASLVSQLGELFNATIYQPTTTISSSGNLPAILDVEAFTDNLNSLLEIAAEPTPTPTTYTDFTGTDGVSAGTAGLVPAPATTDVDKFLKSDGTWDTAGGGSSVNVVQTTGTSQANVMSQNATTSMVFHDPNIRREIQIGSGADSRGTNSVAIGYNAALGSRTGSIVIGANAGASAVYATAIGYQAQATRKGEFNIGSGDYTAYGFNNTKYRVLGGVHDGQDAHDAATVGQVNATIDAINTALSTNIPHIGAAS